MKYRIHILLLFLIFLNILAPVSLSAGNQKKDKIPLAAGICINKAQLMFQTGNVQNAILILETFIDKAHGQSPEMIKSKGYHHHFIYFLLGNYYMALSQSEPGVTDKNQLKIASQKAMKHYESCVADAPSFSSAWLNLAKCRYESEDFIGAATAFEKGYETTGSELSQRKAIHLYFAAMCYFQTQDHDKSLSVFNRLLADHPNSVTLTWKEVLVNVLFSLGKNKKALPYIEELSQRSPVSKIKKWQEILLHQYLYLEMDQKSLRYARFLTQKDPLEPKWWKGLSHIYLKNNNIANGLSALLIYGYLTPMTPEEFKTTAELYLSLEIPSMAAVFYENALKQGHDPEIIKNLAQAFAMAFDRDTALEWIDKGLALSKDTGPLDPDLLILKAQILYVQQSYVKSADTYEQITQSSAAPKNKANAWLMLGYAAMNCSQLDRASRAFKMATNHKPHKKQALKAIDSINTMKSQALNTHGRFKPLGKEAPYQNK